MGILFPVTSLIPLFKFIVMVSKIMTKLKKLPVGKQTFQDFPEQGYLYVDKTRLIHRLITEKNACFLSRPRRFGKSLLVSTMEAIFQGKKELFNGLWIYKNSDYNWSV